MAVMKKVKSRELFMGKLSHGGDLLEEITKLVGNISLKDGTPLSMHILLWQTKQERPMVGILRQEQ